MRLSTVALICAGLASASVAGTASAQATLAPSEPPSCEVQTALLEPIVDLCTLNGWYGDSICDPQCYWFDEDCGEGDEDVCAAYGWYGDGECDSGCASDPDCAANDPCEQDGLYCDGICDMHCASPDPDCAGGSSDSHETTDVCEQMGWYGDGICDEGCPQPDPDC